MRIVRFLITKNVDATNPSQETIEEARDYRYPLTLSRSYPARIIFRAIKIEGVDIAEKIGDNYKSLIDRANEFSLKITGESLTSSVSDAKTDPENEKRNSKI